MIRIRIKLSRLLGDRRMKQKQLEELTGIRAATINNYYQENTDRVSLVFLAMMMEALNCDLTDLLEVEVTNDGTSAIEDYRVEREVRQKDKKNRSDKNDTIKD